MLNYCCLFHKYDVSLTPYCETTHELATTFNCLERRSPNASSPVNVPSRFRTPRPTKITVLPPSEKCIEDYTYLMCVILKCAAKLRILDRIFRKILSLTLHSHTCTK